jgi:hypothetical protein
MLAFMCELEFEMFRRSGDAGVLVLCPRSASLADQFRSEPWLVLVAAREKTLRVGQVVVWIVSREDCGSQLVQLIER